MRRTFPLMLSLPFLATALVAGSVSAQESTTRGFHLGLHASGASLQVQDGDRSNAGGGGVVIGYGINRRILLFLQADGATFDVRDTDIEGEWTMAHVDLGVRYHFASSLRSWVPYLQAAFSGRTVNVDNAVVNQMPAADGSMLGGAFSVGGGLMVYFKETLALDLQLIWSNGKFTEFKVGNLTESVPGVDARSSRFNIGVSWWL